MIRLLLRHILSGAVAAIFISPSVSCSNSISKISDTSSMLSQAFVLTLFSPFVNSSVVDYSNLESPTRGRLLSSQLKWDISKSYIETFVNIALSTFDSSTTDLSALYPDYGVQYYAITYETIDTRGNLITASGSIWIPNNNSIPATLAFCHGTSLDSVTDGFTGVRTLGIVYAAKGYYAVVPDYIGYGASEEMEHPYLHAGSLASSTIDMIRASRRFAQYNGIIIDTRFFLTGVSEGGMAALATLKELQANSMSYTDAGMPAATAPISGPYDLETTTANYLTPGRVFNSLAQPAYIEFIIPAYNEIYGINRELSYYINPPYVDDLNVQRFPRADWVDTVATLPYTSSELLTPSFLSSYNGGGEIDLKNAIANNNTYNFAPASPVRLYASEGDTQVPFTNATKASSQFVANGSTTTSTEILPATAGDHSQSAVLFVAHSLEWFAGF